MSSVESRDIAICLTPANPELRIGADRENTSRRGQDVRRRSDGSSSTPSRETPSHNCALVPTEAVWNWSMANKVTVAGFVATARLRRQFFAVQRHSYVNGAS